MGRRSKGNGKGFEKFLISVERSFRFLYLARRWIVGEQTWILMDIYPFLVQLREEIFLQYVINLEEQIIHNISPIIEKSRQSFSISDSIELPPFFFLSLVVCITCFQAVNSRP